MNLGIVYAIFVVAQDALEFFLLDDKQSVGAAPEIKDLVLEVVIIGNDTVLGDVEMGKERLQLQLSLMAVEQVDCIVESKEGLLRDLVRN
ncbi:hypothetical protein D9M69_658840 [compost metagenome]